MNYPLKDLARFSEYEGAKVGLLIDCPNCGVPGGVYFRAPIGGPLPEWARVLWDRTGDTIETMSLHPSVMMHGHFHSWVRAGQLCVDSPFSCTKIREEDGMAKNGKEVKNAVVDAKCKKSADECKDATCPVHKAAEETAEKSVEEDQSLTESAAAATPGSLCGNREADILCGQPREAHTVGAAKGDVGMDHNFIEARGDDKVAAAEEEAKRVAAQGQENEIVSIPEPEFEKQLAADAELVAFVVSRGYSEEAAKKIIADRGDMVREDFEKSKLASPEVHQALNDAAEVLEYMQHKNEDLLRRLEGDEEPTRGLLLDVDTELGKVAHPNAHIEGVRARIKAILG